ncbi:hypothetical protein AGOR_G00090700 [Albula goreensis]|uniref:Ribosomal L1 domain-containing protein 1 n=1 Tax=Albula goreensis TaxID=1534307 RepID=A0A8T3DEW0_9TELE|nr:hypothetical protein AGOR_G00090700 [Albula goreensis]
MSQVNKARSVVRLLRSDATHVDDMASEKTDESMLDRVQVKKAVQALQAYLKSASTKSKSLLLDESQHISLLFTLWRIPKQEITIRIPLPHGIRSDTAEVCLFTKDEPNMTPDQTERFYKKLLSERGDKRVTEVIPLKALKTEYKPFEAKRRLLGNFELFLADARIYRLLPSLIGKHFYQAKKNPLSVNLQNKYLANELERVIQGSVIHVSRKGSCSMAHVANSEMAADEVVENIMAAVDIIASKLPLKGQSIKVIHLKSQSSIALPIYTSDLSHLAMVEEAAFKAFPRRKKVDKKKVKRGRSRSRRAALWPQKSSPKQRKRRRMRRKSRSWFPWSRPAKSPSWRPHPRKDSEKQQRPQGRRGERTARPQRTARDSGQEGAEWRFGRRRTHAEDPQKGQGDPRNISQVG